MIDINNNFPVFHKNSIIEKPEFIADKLLSKGVCYIQGYEDMADKILEEFDSLNIDNNGSIKRLQPKKLKKLNSQIYSILFAPEYKKIKQLVLGNFFKDEIEIFCQNTGPTKNPLSNELHFDVRYTFKSWFYLNDVGIKNGPMRVVPLDSCADDISPKKIREKIGARSIVKSKMMTNVAEEFEQKKLGLLSEYITGPKGTFFFHITEAWHGSSPVEDKHRRKIIRGHSRKFFDHYIL